MSRSPKKPSSRHFVSRTDLPGKPSHGGFERVRQDLLARILATVGTQDSFDEYRFPRGDLGLFGPTSVPWVIHRDLPAMLIGGFSALMLQTLHPLAMAGIAQHSAFRTDPLGRLQRTARFVVGTTFGPTKLADQLIDQVLAVHRRVVGLTDDALAYSANDPDLLTWVHTTEVWSFLRAFDRYAKVRLEAVDKDRYLQEVAMLAFRLGATDVPQSVAEVDAYMATIQPTLRVTPDAKSAVGFLRTSVSKATSEKLAHRIITTAAIDLLPTFARRQLGLSVVPLVSPVVTRTSARALGGLMRWAVGPSRIAAAAQDRVSGAF